jgi:hypothetical protein
LGREYETSIQPSPGDVLRLTLFWRRGMESQVGDAFTVGLTDRLGRLVWETALLVAGGTYGPSAWKEGEIVRDLHRLHLPPDLPPGTYRLTLRVAGTGVTQKPHVLQRVVIQR